ncbi:MAG: hypothetical protein ACTH31_02530 [Pseudoclavibacter sp.]
MTASTSPIRRRVATAALAFAVVSGGAFLSASPAFAATETPTPTETTTPTETAPVIDPIVTPAAAEISAEEFAANGIFFQGEGFDPESGEPVVVDIAYGDEGAPLEETATVDENGAFGYTVNYEGAEAPTEGVYTFTFTQGENVASTQVTIGEAPVETTEEPTETTTPTYDGPVGDVTQDVFAPSDVVTYTLANFTPGALADVTISGPVEGSLEVEIGEDGTYAGEITYNEYDATTGEVIRRLDFPTGEYSVTVTERETGNTVTFTFTVAGETDQAPVTDDNGNSLESTGSDDMFGIAGLGLLVLGAGVGALALNRRLSAKRAK